MSDQVISVITAVHPQRAEHIGFAYSSLREQRLPAGWQWQWVVQQDGDSANPLWTYPPSDDRVSFAVSRHGGAGVARTVALSRATGSLIKTLDADDQLAPGALARDIEVMTDDPDVDWATCRARDVYVDGSVREHGRNPVPGRIYRDEIVEDWLAARLPLVHPATLCVRREILFALGGWMALPSSEDTGLVLALNTLFTGWFHDEVGLLYRKWPGQFTVSAEHTDPVPTAARHSVIEQRIMAMRALLRSNASPLVVR